MDYDYEMTLKELCDRKRFVRYKTAMILYEMGRSKIEQMAKDAGARYKLDKLILINTKVFEEYLETFREPPT